jgi:uncharacterized SAM-binding protein YcdF (DUF218 family)
MLAPSSRASRRAERRGFFGWRALLFVPALFALFVLTDAALILAYPGRAKLSCRAETALVMGAAQYDGVPSPAFARRLDRALELYESGCASRIVVTGGKQPGDRFTEGEAGLRYLEGRGVPASALAAETRSRTSFENLAYAAPLLGGRQLTIVTDDLHAYRTRYLAERLGYAAELAPVATSLARIPYWLREVRILSAYHLGVVR